MSFQWIAALAGLLMLVIPAASQSVEELERTRDQWQKPKAVLDELGVKPGWVVADVGAGAGYFTFILSKRVGDTGSVLALDINPAAIELLKAKAKEQRVSNVFPMLTRPDDPRLSPGFLDLALIVETYHDFESPVEMLAGLRKALKRNALLCIIDVPRSAQQKTRHAIAKEVVIEQVTANGFQLERDLSGLLPRQFMLVFRKAKAK